MGERSVIPTATMATTNASQAAARTVRLGVQAAVAAVAAGTVSRAGTVASIRPPR